MAKAKKKRKLTQKQLDALAKGRAMKYGRKLPKSRIKTQKVQKVAKKRRSYKRSKAPQKSSFLKGVAPILGAVGYGMVRERVSNMVANSSIGQKLPSSQFTDEAVMLALNFGARKVGLNKGLMRPVLTAQKNVEWARVGQTFSDILAKKNIVATSSGSNKVMVYPV
jgi:hypothetical protein